MSGVNAETEAMPAGSAVPTGPAGSAVPTGPAGSAVPTGPAVPTGTAAGPAAGGAARQAAGLPRLLPPMPGVAEDLRAHLARNGRPRYRSKALLHAVKAAGLTGRGGAAFPTHIKLSAVANAKTPSGRKVVVANGAESEPGSSKDAALLYHAPHLVLDGLQLAAEAVGAREAYLYLHTDPGGRVSRAIAERARNWTGEDLVPVTIVEAPPRFLAGQETALVNRIAGGPALPTFGLQRVSERGIAGAPTLVQNVETLAQIALISAHGPDWFRERGTRTEPGTMLVTLHTGGRPRITELDIGTPLADLLSPGLSRGLSPGDVGSAVLIGGYHGSWLPMAQAHTLTMDNLALTRHKAALGAGVLAVLPRDACGLVEVARVTRYLAAESAGQCGPCLNGLPRIAVAMAELAGLRPRRRTLDDVRRWAGLVTGRGACHHPDGTARFVGTALTVFGAELKRHASGQCSATSSRPVLPLPDSGAMPSAEEDWL
jgi:NADH:ubiquinone oxidoreductase subunit F (NADH-binding)